MGIADVQVPYRLKTEVKQNWLLALLKLIHYWVPAPLKSILGRLLAFEWEKKNDEAKEALIAFLKTL